MESTDELLQKLAAERPHRGKASGGYTRAGDRVFFHIEIVPYVARKVDLFFTVLEAIDDRRVVGFVVRDVDALKRLA